MTVLPLLCEATALCTAPLMTEIKIAAPKRWKKCRLTFPARPERPSSSVPGELKGITTPVGRPRLRPEHEDSRGALRDLPAGLAHELRSPFHEHRGAIGTEGVGRGDARGHPGQGGIERGLQGAINEGALRQQEPLRRQHLRAHRGRQSSALRALAARHSRPRRPGSRSPAGPPGGPSDGRATYSFGVGGAGSRIAVAPARERGSRQAPLQGNLGGRLGGRLTKLRPTGDETAARRCARLVADRWLLGGGSQDLLDRHLRKVDRTQTRERRIPGRLVARGSLRGALGRAALPQRCGRSTTPRAPRRGCPSNLRPALGSRAIARNARDARHSRPAPRRAHRSRSRVP